MKRELSTGRPVFFSEIADLSQPSKLRIEVWFGQWSRAAERQPCLASGESCSRKVQRFFIPASDFFLAAASEDGD